MVSAASQRGWSRPPGPQLAKVAGHSGWPQQMAKAANAGPAGLARAWVGAPLVMAVRATSQEQWQLSFLAERVALLREEEPSSQEL